MYCIEYGYIKRICFYYPAWCCADLSEQECFSVLGRQIYTGHFPLSPYMPLLYTYSKPMCVYNIGVCIAVVLWLDFLFMPCIMGRKCTASISCPWRGGGTPTGLRRENKHHGGHGCRHQRRSTHIRVTEGTVARNGPICCPAFVFYLVFVQWRPLLSLCDVIINL